MEYQTAEIETPSGRKERPKVVDNKDGSVGIVYTPNEEGLHKLRVDYNDRPIEGSPFEFFVASQQPGVVTAHGPGLSHGVSDEDCHFTVVTKDAGNGLEVFQIYISIQIITNFTYEKCWSF